MEKQSTTQFEYTQDQKLALEAISEFLKKPDMKYFVLEGKPGCGKTTLVKEIINQIYKENSLMNTLGMDNYMNICLTATTNKAVEALSMATSENVETIHRLLNLRVVPTDTGKKELKRVKYGYARNLENTLIIIDEAFYMDKELFKYIDLFTQDAKILFVGDPAQLTPVGSTTPYLSTLKYPTVSLNQVVRQEAGNPIIALSDSLRETVFTGGWETFTPDGHHIQILSRDEFNAKIKEEFLRDDWKASDSKILAWTNQTVNNYNKEIFKHRTGRVQPMAGDYFINNSFVSGINNQASIKTDATVLISAEPRERIYGGVSGLDVPIYNLGSFFCPHDIKKAKKQVNDLRSQNKHAYAHDLESKIMDLRPAFAQTIDKSQGSTYGSVFLDLYDVNKCNDGDRYARMLLVACSRAKHHVYITEEM